MTKKLCLPWVRLEAVNEVVYRRLPGSKQGEEDYLQLLVPKSDVEEVLRLCHALPIQSCIPNLKSLAQAVFEILRSKRIGGTSLTFQGHVTSSVT